MSGSSAKKARRVERQRPLGVANAEAVIASAERVLTVDLSLVPSTHVTQFIVGWLRNFFEQSHIIATLTLAGRPYAASPNTRSWLETALRLQWLHDVPHEDRLGAVDAMLDYEREHETKTFEHLAKLGAAVEVDLSEMNDFVLNVTDKGPVKDQARKFASAVHATDVKAADLYRWWRDETHYSHAGGFLAGAYAPAGPPLRRGTPPVIDPDLEAHRVLSVFVVTLVYGLLCEEGTDEEVAMALVTAFFSV
jgi:hypothetical protein